METRILASAAVAALALTVLSACSPGIEPEHEAAYAVLADVVALQEGDPVRQDELSYKTPAGVTVYVQDDVVVVVNLADGIIVAEQLGSDGAVSRFDSIAAYGEWDVSAPGIPSYASAYADNVERAQRLYYAEHGAFATHDALIAWSRSDDNAAPDLGPLENYGVAVTADAVGYLALINTDLEDRAILSLGYCPSAPDVPLDDLGALVEARAAGDDILLGCLEPDDDGLYRAEPLEYVTPDPALIDDAGRVAAVEIPAF